MNWNQIVDLKFPYKKDIDPRLIRFLRQSYSNKINDVKPCVPIQVEYSITKNDIIDIQKYLHKYNINTD